MGGLGSVRLKGYYVAYGATFTDVSCKADCPPDHQDRVRTIEVYNVRTRRARTVQDGAPLGGALVLSSRGGVAWASRSTATGPVEMRASARAGDNRVIDSGAIDPKSLAIEITIISLEARRRRTLRATAVTVGSMPAPLIEFPADDAGRARRFWDGVLGVDLAPRPAAAGSGWEAASDGLRLGIHDRGPGPGRYRSLPYFTVADLAATLARVGELGGSVIHPGERWAVCRDSEGSPFALAAAPAAVE